MMTSHSRGHRRLLGLALVLALGGTAACGSDLTPPATPASVAPATAPAATPLTGPPAAWESMNKEQRKAYMKQSFLPRMKGEFVAFDPKKFADMKCATCHGDGVDDGSFKMPNPKLPKLSVADGFKKHMEKTPELTKFMMTRVVPDSAALLGQPPYDPKTHLGFGCMKCHTMEP